MPIFTRPGRVTVYDREIDRDFKPGGDIRPKLRKVANYHVYIAQGEAPKRTGAMAASVGYRVLPAFKKYSWMYTMGVGADYAIYTLAGTKGPIRSNRPAKPVSNPGDLTGSRSASLVVRPAPHSHYLEYTRRTSVRGQSANDWLGRATAILMRKLP